MKKERRRKKKKKPQCPHLHVTQGGHKNEILSTPLVVTKFRGSKKCRRRACRGGPRAVNLPGNAPFGACRLTCIRYLQLLQWLSDEIGRMSVLSAGLMGSFTLNGPEIYTSTTFCTTRRRQYASVVDASTPGKGYGSPLYLGYTHWKISTISNLYYLLCG